MTNTEPPVVDQDDNDLDQARQRSLQLGGSGGGLPIGKVFGKYASFLTEVRDELRKVTWPTRKQVVTETAVVLVVVVGFTLLITGLDRVLSLSFNAVLFGK